MASAYNTSVHTSLFQVASAYNTSVHTPLFQVALAYKTSVHTPLFQVALPLSLQYVSSYVPISGGPNPQPTIRQFIRPYFRWPYPSAYNTSVHTSLFQVALTLSRQYVSSPVPISGGPTPQPTIRQFTRPYFRWPYPSACNTSVHTSLFQVALPPSLQYVSSHVPISGGPTPQPTICQFTRPYFRWPYPSAYNMSVHMSLFQVALPLSLQYVSSHVPISGGPTPQPAIRQFTRPYSSGPQPTIRQFTRPYFRWPYPPAYNTSVHTSLFQVALSLSLQYVSSHVPNPRWPSPPRPQFVCSDPRRPSPQTGGPSV